jgi:hypothetical protein
MAAYPNTTKVFTSKVNVTDVVDAAHVNELQQEVIAIEETLGVNPHVSGSGAGPFTTVRMRLDYLDVNKSQTTHGHTHANLGALSSDDHLLYLTTGRHDNSVRHAFGGAFGIPGTPTTSTPGDAAVVGTDPAPARGNHRHAREAVGPASALATHTHTRRFPHSWLVAGEARVPAGAADHILGMYVPASTGQTVKLAGLRYEIYSGTSVTISFLRRDVAVSGLQGIVVTPTTGQTFLSVPVTLSDGDELRPLVTAISGAPVHLQITAYLDYTLPS